MNFAVAVKSSSSDITSTLSATVVAATAIMAGPILTTNDPPGLIQSVDYSYSPTDSGFVLMSRAMQVDLAALYNPITTSAIHAHRPQLLGPSPDMSRLPLGASWFSNMTHDVAKADSLVPATSGAAAVEFYNQLPDETKSDLLWDIISLAQVVGTKFPVVQQIDDAVTVDFSAPGHLFSVMIDHSTCFLSSFSPQKELTMSYVCEDGQPVDALTDVIWLQLRDLQAGLEA